MTRKTLLVTRPSGDEQALMDLLHAHGYRVIHEPLTTIFLQHTQRQALERALLSEPDAVLVTSRHAVQALALLSDMRDAFLVCVGEATARVAYSLGFTRVSTAGGNAQGMIDAVTASYDPGSRFLYVSGEHIRTDLDAILTARHMQIQRLALYEAVASEQLSDTLLEQLKRMQVDGVTFLSQRTASIFNGLLAKAEADYVLPHLHGFCLSAVIAEPLASRPWKGIHITREATLASLVECVDNTFQTKR